MKARVLAGINTRGPVAAALRERGTVRPRGGYDFRDPTFLERINRALRGIQEHRLLAKEIPRYGWIRDDLEELEESWHDAARPKNLLGRNHRSPVGGLPTQQTFVRDPAYEAVNYHRFADDIVITVSGHHTKRGWAERALQRLEEQLIPLGVTLNREKTKIVDTLKGEAFGFPGV